jgi:hypothetical protein
MMMSTARRSLAHVLIATATACTALSVTAIGSAGAAPLDPVDVTFPAGLVCPFALHVEGTGGDQVVHELDRRNGDLTTISTGTGQALTFTNVVTGQQLQLESRGSTKTTVTHPDGSMTVRLTGSNVLFLFPTDVPAGPSTTLHVGVLVYEDDGSANFVVDQRRTHSRTTDICAAVS